MHCTTWFIRLSPITFTKSLWSVIGLCFSSGNESNANTLPCGRLYFKVIRNCGIATKPLGQAPLRSANARCVRWLALSVFLPSQQPGKSAIRTVWLPRGHSGYFVVTRFSNPLQVHLALALAPPLVDDFASPVRIR